MHKENFIRLCLWIAFFFYLHRLPLFKCIYFHFTAQRFSCSNNSCMGFLNLSFLCVFKWGEQLAKIIFTVAQWSWGTSLNCLNFLLGFWGAVGGSAGLISVFWSNYAPVCRKKQRVLEIHWVDSVHPGPLVEPVFNTKDICFSRE